MNLTEIKNISKEYGIAPSKSRGQNFLHDQNIIDKIIKSANISPDDVVVEVGPGLGALTGQLVKQAKKVKVVELDKRVIEFLNYRFNTQDNFEIIEGDILRINPVQFGNGGYRIISNLPYNITSKFLRIFLGLSHNRPTDMILMLQNEVAERIVAKPGKMSVLAVMAQFYSDPEILFTVSPGSFWPAPKVTSAIISFKLRAKLPNINTKKFFQVVKMGFSAKRKQLHKNLACLTPGRQAGGLKIGSAEVKKILAKMGLREDIRAQNLGVDDWIKLVKDLP